MNRIGVSSFGILGILEVTDVNTLPIADMERDNDGCFFTPIGKTAWFKRRIFHYQ